MVVGTYNQYLICKELYSRFGFDTWSSHEAYKDGVRFPGRVLYDMRQNGLLKFRGSFGRTRLYRISEEHFYKTARRWGDGSLYSDMAGAIIQGTKVNVSINPIKASDIGSFSTSQ